MGPSLFSKRPRRPFTRFVSRYASWRQTVSLSSKIQAIENPSNHHSPNLLCTCTHRMKEDCHRRPQPQQPDVGLGLLIPPTRSAQGRKKGKTPTRITNGACYSEGLVCCSV